MIKTLPITEARKEINNIASSIKSEDTISVTNRGREVLAILPWQTYEAIIETLEIMSDPEMMSELKQSIEDYKSGRTEDWESIKGTLGLV